ncbi:hypothetical protein [Bacillus sp. CRN 9]|uniref:hypothetical protein n=1 Tax=Cytobacillus horneckiae TaxID=549687 RepID=UPI0015620E84|nr:hypothetical protein [Bacillus sp. CRN 9]
MRAAELVHCNELFLKHLNSGLPVEEREAYLAESDRFLEQRGKIMTLINFQAAETTQLQNILIEQDQEIQSKLQAQQKVIKEDMKKLKLQREKNKQYANPYQSIQQHDGTFYDKRN